MAALSLTRSHGVGCGSLRSTRKTKGARQADDADQAQRRGDADPRHRPEIGDDLGDPALPHRPEVAVGIAVALPALQRGAQRRHEIEQRGAPGARPRG